MSKIIYFCLLAFLYTITLPVNNVFAGADDANYGSAIVDSVTSIYDGDTFRANIKDYPAIIGHRVSIRIAGIDTPEMADKRQNIKELARKAKQYAVMRLREGKVIKLENMRRDKYFRILADVIIDGTSLGAELISKGLAKKYDGGTKEDW